jgi:hypothetical protein
MMMNYEELKTCEFAMMLQLSEDRYRPRDCELETRAILSELRALMQPFEDRQQKERVARTAMITAQMSRGRRVEQHVR